MCEEILLPQKLYYRKGSLHTVAHEMSIVKAAVFFNNQDIALGTTVVREIEGNLGCLRVYPLLVDDQNVEDGLHTVNSILKQVDTIVVVGDYKLQNIAAIAVDAFAEQRQFVVVAVDAKPLHLMTGWYMNLYGAPAYSRKVIPEYVILDSGLTERISKHDVELVQQVVANVVETNMVTFTHTAYTISADLISGYGKLDMPVWKEKATNLVGICMLGQPDGKLVLKALFG